MDQNDKPLCECGCGQERNTGAMFLPGHDQHLRTAIEKAVGGLLPLRALVKANGAYAAGMTDTEEFTKTVRHIFASKPR